MKWEKMKFAAKPNWRKVRAWEMQEAKDVTEIAPGLGGGGYAPEADESEAMGHPLRSEAVMPATRHEDASGTRSSGRIMDTEAGASKREDEGDTQVVAGAQLTHQVKPRIPRSGRAPGRLT